MSIRVLIVDDQAVVREGLVLLLGLLPGIEVVGSAGDGEVALRMVASERPDVVLMDLRMPRMDGVEATRRVRADHPGTQVVVLTTYSDDESVFAALRAGARGFLTKSADSDEIAKALTTVMRGDAQLDPTVQRRLLESMTSTPSTLPPPPAHQASHPEPPPPGSSWPSDTPSGHPQPAHTEHGVPSNTPPGHVHAAHTEPGAPNGTGPSDPRLEPTAQPAQPGQTAPAEARAGEGGGTEALPDGLTRREAEVLALIADGLSNGEISDRLFISESTVKTHINNLFAKAALRSRAQAVTYAYRHGLAHPERG
jgi:DNA-binding NarL/FixJ family response regulator